MAELTFFYGSMGSCKSAHLLTTSFNYEERGKTSLILTSSLDNRYGFGKVTSRLGIESPAVLIHPKDNVFKKIKNSIKSIDLILVDEINLFTKAQVDQLSNVVDSLGINVYCYGIRTDFKTKSFTSTIRLLEIADNIIELKSICHCGKRAIVNARICNGKVVRNGPKILIGGNESYVALCRSCWKKGILK